MTAATSSTLFPQGSTPGAYAATPRDADAVLDGLDPEQREVATSLHGAVCVLAGAGTGKTRAITHRIAYGVRAGMLQPASVLAVTFTNRAAGEMRGRLRQLGAGGVQARTFHSAALRQLQYFWPKAVGGEVPRLVERKVQLVAEAAARCRVRLDRNELRDVTGEIEWSKVTQTVPEDYPAVAAKSGREAPRDAAEIGRIYATYEQLKRDRGVIDFEDVLLLTVGVLQERHDIADQVRRQYQHFVVDEYQDVSPLQQRLLELWLGDRDSLCVVGDASQTIYSFTGATPDHLLNFRTRHPGATVVKLIRDYRSTPQVVHLANGLLSQARGRAAEHRLELVSQREAGPDPVYVAYADEPAEAEGTARRIRELITPVEQGAAASRRARSRSSTGSTPSRSSMSRRWPMRRCPISCAVPSGSSSGPRCARRGCCCAARPAGEVPTRRWRMPTSRPRCGPCWAPVAGRPIPRRDRARCATAGSPWPPWCGSPRTSRAAAPGPRSRIWWRSSTSGRRRSTPRPSRV
ncbi:hypothetical protein SSPO_038410 [Streptomyces antimycoticus]|uniref:UvrD-like helicase ATP-binding domain-containing protein n=1 Tax=Streptomyces antimycoticus TaxID=68175 RepID=A0A499UHU0_9ACTN|nr:hypothetical protein SSPO_038410 [Streptomyces antimycoticus]